MRVRRRFLAIVYSLVEHTHITVYCSNVLTLKNYCLSSPTVKLQKERRKIMNDWHQIHRSTFLKKLRGWGVYRGTNDQTPPHELHFYLSNVSLTNPRLCWLYFDETWDNYVFHHSIQRLFQIIIISVSTDWFLTRKKEKQQKKNNKKHKQMPFFQCSYFKMA